jgi:hypothetical protein
MKKVIIFICITSLVCSAQSKDEIDLCRTIQSNSFSSNIDADKALNKILNVIGASKNFVLTPCDNIFNAYATAYKGVRYIVYDRKFMKLINSNTNNWSNLFILAHEVGHHINGHSIDLLLYKGEDGLGLPSLQKKRKQELEADKFAAFILARLGAKLEQLNQIISSVSPNSDDYHSTHPNKSERLKSIKEGFQQGSLPEKKEILYKSKVEKIYVDSNMVEYEKSKSFKKLGGWYLNTTNDLFDGKTINAITSGQIAGSNFIHSSPPRLKYFFEEKTKSSKLSLDITHERLFPDHRSQKIHYTILITDNNNKIYSDTTHIELSKNSKGIFYFDLNDKFIESLKKGQSLAIRFDSYIRGYPLEDIYQDILFEKFKNLSYKDSLASANFKSRFVNQSDFFDFYYNDEACFEIFPPSYKCDFKKYNIACLCHEVKKDPLYPIYWGVRGAKNQDGEYTGEIELKSVAQTIYDKYPGYIDLKGSYFKYDLSNTSKFIN